MVPPARFERTAFPLGGGRYIQLSYGGINEWSLYVKNTKLSRRAYYNDVDNARLASASISGVKV